MEDTILRRFIAFFLAVIVSVMAFPVRALTVSENDLFMRYPYYLKNAEYDAVEDKSFSICMEVLDSQSSFGKYAGIVTATLADDWLSIGLSEIAAKAFGRGLTYAESIRESAILKFVSAIASENSSDSEFSQQVAKNADTWYSVYGEFTGAFDDDKELSDFLTKTLVKMGVKDSHVPAVKEVLLKKIKNPFFIIGKEVASGAETMSIIALYGYRLESVRVLMSAIDKNSDLYKGLDSTLDKMLNHPAKYIEEHFLTARILGAVGDWLATGGQEAIKAGMKKIGLESWTHLVWLYSLSKTLYFKFIYQGYKVDDYAEAVYLMAYMQDVSNARSKLMVKFMQGTASSADITTYKNLVEVSNLTRIATLYAFADLLSIYGNDVELKLKSEAEEQACALEWDHGYDWYFRQCTKALNSALENGDVIEGTAKSRQQNQDDGGNQTPPSQELPIISEVVAPSGTLSYGRSFDLRGIISSSTVISNITANIYNAQGNSIATYSVNPGKTVYNIYSDGLNFQSPFKFGTFSTGSYRYVVSATNAAGTKELINASFSIGSAPQKLSVLRYEDCYVLVQCPYRTVNLYLNPTDTVNEASFGRGQAPKSHRRAIMSDGSTWYEVNVNHNGVETTLWLKYESDINITDLSEPGQSLPISSSNGLSVQSYEDCNVVIQMPNREVNCYLNPTDTIRSSFTIGINYVSQHRAFVNDGSTWYGISSNLEGIMTIEWFKYEDDMTITVPVGSNWEKLSIQRYEDCSVVIKMPDRDVNCYLNPTDTTRRSFTKGINYVSQRRAFMNDGSIWYGISSNIEGVITTEWFRYDSDMTIEDFPGNSGASRIFTVTFNPTGGYVTPSNINVTEQETYGSLPTPVRSDYTFDGWYTSENGGLLITSSSIVSLTEAQTLYAHWTKIPPKVYTVSFEASGGTVYPLTKTVTNGETYGVLPVPEKTGYSFDGWYTSASGGSIVTSSSIASIDEGQRLYAHWTKVPPRSYTITFDPDGGTVSPTSKTVTNGETYGVLPVPVRSGYTFDGWYFVTSGLKIHDSFVVNLTAEQTLRAKWIQDEVELKSVEASLQFSDVFSSNYFFDAVNWAVKNGITNGKTPTIFAPRETCTRAQTVTFLWRAAGSPEPVSNKSSFSDISENAYFYKAVLWAVEQGITKGTTATTFSPGNMVSRAQVVTFLYRSANSPSTGSSNNPFTDVPQNSYYNSAVTWASETGVTQGKTTTTFNPSENCNRGQIVTFLYRHFVR